MPNVWLDCMIQNGDSPATFVAGVSGTQMTVTKVITGNLTIGQDLAGPGVAPGSRDASGLDFSKASNSGLVPSV